MLSQAIEAEVSEFPLQFQDISLQIGQVCVGSGYHSKRYIQTQIGPFTANDSSGSTDDAGILADQIKNTAAAYLNRHVSAVVQRKLYG